MDPVVATQGRRPVLALLLVLLLTVALTACAHAPAVQPSTPAAPGTATASPSASPSQSIWPSHDLFVPGRAQQVVALLVAAAKGRPVVRVTLDRTRARLTYVDEGDRPRSVVWEAGVVTPSEDGTDLVAAVSFNPALFNLSDIASLFRQAAEVSGSDSRQELQITEYDHGQVLMTITTTPESSTVFFHRDGRLIPRLHLEQDAHIGAALDDCVVNRLFVIAIGVDGTQRVWVDVLATPGVVERRIRPANVPMYLTQRRETPATEQFEWTQVDVPVLGRLMRTAPGLLDEPPDSEVSLRVVQPGDAPAPRIIVTVGGSELVTDLSGAPVEGD